MSNVGELACTYAVMILHDEGIPITAEKISTLVKAANVKVESYWPTLFAKLADKHNVDDLILNAGATGGAGGGGAGAVAAAPAAAGPVVEVAAPAVEEKKKKEEPKEESDDEEMIFSLFD